MEFKIFSDFRGYYIAYKWDKKDVWWRNDFISLFNENEIILEKDMISEFYKYGGYLYEKNQNLMCFKRKDLAQKFLDNYLISQYIMYQITK